MNPYEPVEGLYVNAKQYHRILKRREARARLEERLRGLQTTKKPYLHESRHKHAMRRPRGPGGRFLTAEKVSQLKAQEALEAGKLESPSSSENRGLIDTLDSTPTGAPSNEYLTTNETGDDSPSSTLSSQVPANAAGGSAGLDLTSSKEEAPQNPSIFGASTANSNLHSVSASPNAHAHTHSGAVNASRNGASSSAGLPARASSGPTGVGNSVNPQIHPSSATINNQHHRQPNPSSNASTLPGNENLQLRNGNPSAVSDSLSVSGPGVELGLSNPMVLQLDPSNLLHAPPSNQNSPRAPFFPSSTTGEGRPSPSVANHHHSTVSNPNYGNLPSTTHPNDVFHKNATQTYHTTPSSELAGPNGDSFADLDVYQTNDPVTNSLIQSHNPMGPIGDLGDPSATHGSGIPNLSSHHMGHLNLTDNDQDSIIIDQQPYASHDSTNAHP